jgi:hypothetical protein
VVFLASDQLRMRQYGKRLFYRFWADSRATERLYDL